MKPSFEIGTALVFKPGWAKNNKVDDTHPLKYKEVVYFLCDIPNVTGHCIIAKYNGLVVPMVHPEDFEMPQEWDL